MFAGIVSTDLIMHFCFGLLGLTPESSHTINDVAQFAIDNTFFMNLVFALAAAVLVGLHRGWVQHEMKAAAHRHHELGSRLSIKRMIALTSAVVIRGD